MTTLPIADTFLETVQQLQVHGRQLSRALLVPTILAALAAIGPVYPAVPPGAVELPGSLLPRIVASSLVSLFTATLVAVTCHRLVLIGSASLPNRWGVYWSGREVAFLGRLMALGAISIAPLSMVFFWIFTRPESSQPDLNTLLGKAVMTGLWLLTAYPISRLSLVLPAIATNRPMSFRQSWTVSSANGWRLTVVLFLPPFSLSILWHLWNSFMPSIQHVAYIGTTGALSCLLGTFEIVALSCAYRTLVR